MARVEIDSRGLDLQVLKVVLSERNLLILLGKLYTPGSLCTFVGRDVPDGFDCVEFVAESDNVHYASPTRNGAPAGPMHPVSEAVSRAVRDALKELQIHSL